MSGGALLRETARHLALRMSFEDVIRVAQAKIDPARMKRIRDDLKLTPGEAARGHRIFQARDRGAVLGCRLPSRARSWGWRGDAAACKVDWSMDIRSSSVTGFLLRLKLLASLRPWRVRSYRYREEQAAIETWLGLIAEGAALSGALALEIAHVPGAVKGYGDTHARGVGNFAKIEGRLIRPALADAFAPALAVDAIAAARVAALADPDGERLEKTLTEIEGAGARRAAAE